MPPLYRPSDSRRQYDRIDPAEVQSLKDEIERTRTAKEEAEKAVKEREEQVTQLNEKVIPVTARANETLLISSACYIRSNHS